MRLFQHNYRLSLKNNIIKKKHLKKSSAENHGLVTQQGKESAK